MIVLADTHAPRRWKTCPAAVASCLCGAGLILHAGDVCTAQVLDELAGYAPVLAVKGNNDGRDVAAWGAPERLETSIDGLPVAMYMIRSAGHWHAAFLAPPAGAASGQQQQSVLYSVSCTGRFHCAAVGYYNDRSGVTRAEAAATR